MLSSVNQYFVNNMKYTNRKTVFGFLVLYLCALKMNKPYTMNRKQILCISLLAFSLCACQDDDTADILDAFGTPPALSLIHI